MSVVPSTGPLRRLYNDAQGAKYESAGSAFWQIWFQKTFWEDKYLFLCEQGPDDGLTRNDFHIKTYNDEYDTITSLKIGEAKKHGGNLRKVEKQVEDASRVLIDYEHLHGIYSITTRGTLFRVWYMSAEDKVLEPLHGTRSQADLSQYIDADSDEAVELSRTIELIKDNHPLKQEPILPSQPLSGYDLTEGDSAAANMEWEEDEVVDSLDHVMAGFPAGAETYAGEREGEAGSSVQGKAVGHGKRKAGHGKGKAVRIKVKLSKKMTLRGVRFLFTDSNKDTIQSEKSEWVEVDKGWELEYKGTIYVSHKKPE